MHQDVILRCKGYVILKAVKPILVADVYVFNSISNEVRWPVNTSHPIIDRGMDLVVKSGS